MTDDTNDGPARRFRSATMYDGLIRATTRSFLHAMGLDDAEIRRPHVGVFHTGGEMSPCNGNLQLQAQHAKTGIYAGGGMPHECPVVSVSDGLTMAHSGMRFSLVSRELIALSGGRAGENERPVLGMFLGGAGLADTILYCRHKIYPLGLPNWLARRLAKPFLTAVGIPRTRATMARLVAESVAKAPDAA